MTRRCLGGTYFFVVFIILVVFKIILKCFFLYYQQKKTFIPLPVFDIMSNQCRTVDEKNIYSSKYDQNYDLEIHARLSIISLNNNKSKIKNCKIALTQCKSTRPARGRSYNRCVRFSVSDIA